MSKLRIEIGDRIMLDGKEIKPEDIEDLTNEETIELAKTPASVLDIMKIRASTHRLINAVNASLGTMELNIKETNESLTSIKNSLMVRRINGKVEIITAGEGVQELLDMHKGERNRIKFIKSLKNYKTVLLSAAAIAIFVSLKFHNLINTLLQYLDDWVFVAVPFSVIVLILIKLVFKKIFKIKD
jgi:hypothetical protein